jgi:putative Holliday junction resolvase
VAAIDLGRTRVGIAVSDELGKLAHPRKPLSGKSRAALLASLRELAEHEGVGRFVVGLPLTLGGEPGTAARRAMRFCQQLADTTGVEVELVDERLTSVQAQRELFEGGASGARARQRIDGVAAAILLQQWLDARR